MIEFFTVLPVLTTGIAVGLYLNILFYTTMNFATWFLVDLRHGYWKATVPFPSHFHGATYSDSMIDEWSSMFEKWVEMTLLSP